MTEPKRRGSSPRKRPTARPAGSIRLQPEFPSLVLGNKRTVAIYLPPGYEREPERRFPVLYLHDGQNVFDSGTAAFGVAWEAARAADRLIHQGRIVPLIMVGIYNTEDRLNEFTLHHDPARNQGGRGKQYARFVMDEVKPFVDAHYRTLPDRENTAIAGSSMGGLISLSMAREYHDRFSMCGILSPSLWWCNAQILADLEKDPTWLHGMRLWIDMGTQEGSQKGSQINLQNLRRLHATLRETGLKRGQEYSYWEVAGGEHNEASWAARFPGVLEFFFGMPVNKPRIKPGKVPSLRNGVPKPRATARKRRPANDEPKN